MHKTSFITSCTLQKILKKKTLNNISAIASYVDSNGHRIHPSIVSSDKSAFRPIQHEKNSEKFHAASERLAQEQSSQSPTKRVRRRSFSDSEVSLNGLDGQDWPFVPEKLLLTKIDPTTTCIYEPCNPSFRLPAGFHPPFHLYGPST